MKKLIMNKLKGEMIQKENRQKKKGNKAFPQLMADCKLPNRGEID